MNGRSGALVLVIAFIAGGLAGAAADRVYVARQSAVAGEEQGPKLSPAERETRRRAEQEGIPWAVIDLDLTDSQKVAIRALASRRRPQADSLMALVVPRVRTLENEMFEDIICLLTPAQRERYERHMHQLQFPDSILQIRLSRVRAGSCSTPR